MCESFAGPPRNQQNCADLTCLMRRWGGCSGQTATWLACAPRSSDSPDRLLQGDVSPSGQVHCPVCRSAAGPSLVPWSDVWTHGLLPGGCLLRPAWGSPFWQPTLVHGTRASFDWRKREADAAQVTASSHTQHSLCVPHCVAPPVLGAIPCFPDRPKYSSPRPLLLGKGPSLRPTGKERPLGKGSRPSS